MGMETETEMGMEMGTTMEMEVTIQEVAVEVKYATCTLLGGALTWWNSYVRTVRYDASYEMSRKDLMKMMTKAYFPRNEIQKLETELMIPGEDDKVERFILGIPDSIQGNVTSSKPTRLQEAIQIVNNLMDQKVCVYAARQANNKKRIENNPRDNHAQQPPYKRQNVARAYTAGPSEKKEYVGTLPMCNKCKLHYNGPCTVKHYRSECQKLNYQNCKNQTGNGEARGRVYALGGGEADQDPNNIADDIDA
nr:hypothetical protein [Tanacetum cinerariifolium]